MNIGKQKTKNKKQKTKNSCSLFSVPCSFNAGLTFIELIVVISIFSVIASVTLFNFSSFSTNITSQNLAQQIALSIKQAQSESISGTRRVLFDPSDQDPEGLPSYGVYFKYDPASASRSEDGSSYIYFADKNGNGLYDPSGSGCDQITGTECLSVITIDTSDRITGVCADMNCTTSNNGAGELTVTFKRPFPTAHIRLNGGSSDEAFSEIRISSIKGISRLVTLNSLGQISVKDTTAITQ